MKNLKFKVIEDLFSKHVKLTYIFIFFIYFLIKLIDIFFINSFPSLAFPLNSIYISNLLFHDFSLNNHIINTLSIPSNASLIYPPGIYILSKIFTSVHDIVIFLFLWQALVPILLYKLFISYSSRIIAFIISIFASYYLTAVNWWSPDFIIQPLMILIVLIIAKNTSLTMRNIILLGILSSIIFIFKHNIGVFLGILIGVIILFNSMTVKIATLKEKITLSVVFLGFLIFGLVFMSKVIYFDEIVFFLFPYFIFLGITTYIIMKRKYGLDIPKFILHVSIYSFVTLFLPSIIFAVVGEKFGYANYWHSLFGMGLDYLHIWDHGIVGIIKLKLNFSSMKMIAASGLKASLYLLPLIINIMSLIFLTQLIRKNEKDILTILKIVSMGMMASFMFFPLEGYHILSTKLFIFIFVLLYITKNRALKQKVIASFFLFFIVPGMIYSGYKINNFSTTEFTSGTVELQKVIGMPIDKEIADQLIQQIKVIKQSTRGNGYYTLDTAGITLIGLSALTNNPFLQYYMEMRSGILKEDAVSAIKNEMEAAEYVIVRETDYDLSVNGTIEDIYFNNIITFARQNYIVIAKYEKPQEYSKKLNQIHNFYVLKYKYK